MRMTRIAALLIGANFAVALGYGAILPLLPVLLARIGVADVSAAAGLHAGGLTSIYMFALFAGALTWGRALERLGARTTLLAALLGYAISLASIAAVSEPAWAYGLRAIAGFFAGALPPLTGAFAAADPEPARRARAFAASGAATLVGLLAGPALSGGVVRLMQFMSGSNDMSAATVLWSMGATAIVALAVAAAALRTPGLELPPAAADRERVESPAWARRPGVFAANFLVLAGLGAFEVMLPLRGERALGLDPGSLALMFAECSAVMIAVQAVLFFTPVLARVPGRAVIAVGFTVMAIGAAGLAVARTESGMYAAIGLIAVSSGWLLPAIGYFASASAGATGTLLGVLTGIGILGQAVGSVAGGWLYDRVASGALWLVAGALAAGVALALRREFDQAAVVRLPSPVDGDQAVAPGP
jgi:MFS family permease